MKLFAHNLELRAIATICRGGKNAELFLARLSAKHFHYPPAKTSYERVMNLMRKKGAIPSYHELEVDPVLDEDYRSILSNYENRDGLKSAKRIDACFESLENYRKIREVYYATKKALEALEDSKIDVDAVIQNMSDKLASASATVQHAEQLVHIGKGNNSTSVVKNILYGESDPVIPTGFKTFDEKNGGFFKSGVAVLSANSGGGKSVGALQLAVNMYYAGYSTCVITLEMSEEQYMSRFLSNISGVPAARIFLKRLSADDKNKVKTAYRKFVEYGKANNVRWTILSPKGDMSLDQILLTCKPYGFDVVTIDYISLLQDAATENQVRALGDITRKCKVFATSTNSLVIMLAQLNEEDKVKYARAIVENADHLWTWRYGENERETHLLTIRVDKGRNQQCFPFEVTEDFGLMRIEDNGPVRDFDKESKDGQSEEIEKDDQDLFESD